MPPKDASSDDAVKQLEKKLKSYEGKLATLTAINSALQNENDDLRQRLSTAQSTPASANAAEIEELKEEFAKRLAAAERQVQKALEDRDDMRSQLRLVNEDGNAVASKLQDKEEYIQALQVEGEKLSRKNGELEAIARKVRAQLREAEGEKEKLEASLAKAEAKAAKLSDKLKQTTDENAAEIAAIKAEAQRIKDEAAVAVEAAQQRASESLHENQQQSARQTAETLAAVEGREAALVASLAELRSNLEDVSSSAAEKEAALRAEASALESRVRELEAVNHALQNNTSEATGPLLRQIESMAAAASVQQVAAQEAEQRLLQKLAQVERSLAAMTEQERLASGRASAAESAHTAARESANASSLAAAEAKSQLEVEKNKNVSLKAEIEHLQQQLQQAAALMEKRLAAKELELQRATEQLYECEDRLRKSNQQHQELQERLEALEIKLQNKGAAVEQPSPKTAPTIPKNNEQQHIVDTDEIGADLSGSIDDYDSVDVAALMKSVGTSESEHNVPPDHSRVKMLEQRLRQAEAARDAANEQLMLAMARAGDREADAARSLKLKKDLEDAKTKLDLALEVIGERNERIDQLEEDIRDMKHIFHKQLEVAVDQLHAARLQLEQVEPPTK